MCKIKLFCITLLLLCVTSCHHRKDTFFSYTEGKTGIAGVVTRNDAPEEGVEVYLYRNLKSNFRGPADFMDITDVNGQYFIDVPRGDYYIICRKRKSGKASGALRKGDYYSNPIYEPVVVKDGRTAKVDLSLRQLLGALIQQSSGTKKTDTYIDGVIVDETGAPKKGVYAFAYEDNDFKREPDYFSTATVENGIFRLYFKEGGRYYLGARGAGRGIPKPGELFSFYDGPRGSGILVKGDEKISGIKIILREYK